MVRTNGSQSPDTTAEWGKIREVSVEDIPVRAGKTSKWRLLAEALLLRLEKTERKFALEVPFRDEKTANNARMGLRKLLKSLINDDVLEITQRHALLYVRRGKNWKASNDS